MERLPAFMGIDLGTTGIRIIVSDERGNVVCMASRGVEKSFVPSEDRRISEQNTALWEPVLKDALKTALQEVLDSEEEYDLKAVCCDSTSGTVLPVDRNFRPVYNAILHNDTRAYEESDYINKNTTLTVQPSFALSKILWFKRHREDVYNNTYRFIHAADYIRGLISDGFDITDFSNAVKTGYDLASDKWPDEIEDVLEIPKEKLPKVEWTGRVIGELKEDIWQRSGAKKCVKVVAGATDSTTGFYSSGARKPGDWNTTLGTVLGIKGISERFIKDPEGLLYTHRHPEGFWLPGAASSSGGEILKAFFGNSVEEYDNKAEKMSPTGSLIYPLVHRGEKLPFMNNDAYGFINMNICDPLHLYKGILEGLAYVERMIYEKIERLGYPVGDRVFTMGGGAKSEAWMKSRAGVLNKGIYRAEVTDTAFGSCIIAASGVHYKNLSEAIENMVRTKTVFEPDANETALYDELYERFVAECRDRGLF
jgi:sugar (pentulose or hexulose) kinase